MARRDIKRGAGEHYLWIDSIWSTSLLCRYIVKS